MTTDPKTNFRMAPSSQVLTNVLVQSEHVKDMVEEAAEELSSVNMVLKQELADRGSLPEVEDAIQKARQLKSKCKMLPKSCRS